jgi:YgiT-type zinc finger domain-containing protein
VRRWARKRGERPQGRVEKTKMSSASSTRCTACHKGELTSTQLTVTLTYDGKSFSVDDGDALVCAVCGDELISERAAAFLLTHRALAPRRPDERHGEPHDGERLRHATAEAAPGLHIAAATHQRTCP